MRRKEILKQTIVIVLLLMIAANPVAVINAVNYDNTNAPASAETIYSNSEANVSAEEINAEADVLDGNHRTFKNYWSFLNKSEWRKFAKLDGDFAELVIGVNAPYEKNYNSLISMIRRYCGQVKDKIVMKNEVRAVVASFPFDNVPSVAEDLPRTNAARYVEPNMKISADFVPNDPDWDFQWGPQKIEADYAWNTTMGSHSVLIAIIDTGVDYTHPDLAANYVPVGYDFVNDDADPMDDYGHGTHCAGIAAAVTNNAIGIAGVAQVGVMAEKGLNAEGFGYEDDLAQCIIHAVDQGADVLSNSWGGDSPSQAIEDAIKYACSNGVLVFASAGNTATRSKHYPAAQEEVIAVTATDAYDAPAYFTTYGDWVEISAPGVAIYSTLPRNNYEFKSGTSMSCPHAAGVAALILSRYPDMSMTQRRQAVFYATDDTGDVGFDIYHGYGRINARKGVEEIPIDVDLAVWSWSKPPYVEPGDTGLVNATIYNFGASELNDIMVKLMANGSVVNEQVVSHLSSDSFANTTLEWTP